MLTLIVFILIMSLLVLIHELGHFMAAKKLGVRVEEFGLGIPPALVKKKFGDTEYSLNLLPFGGFVKLSGEDLEEANAMARASQDSTNFVSKTPLQRAVILAAGVFMNVLLAFVLYYVFFFVNGFKSLNVPLIFDYNFRFGTTEAINTVITSFDKDSPALTGGAELGEAIIEINKVPVYSVSDIRREVGGKSGQEVSLLVMDLKNQDQSDLRTITVTPNPGPEGQGILGVYLSKSVVIDYSRGYTKLFAGPLHAYNMLAYSGHVFGKLIGVSFAAKSAGPISEGVAGPVGIYSVIGGILDYGGERALLTMLDFIALMSLSLAFLNIMPFPALDGGRLVFVAFELLTKKKFNIRVEALIHKWGMALLLGLIVLVTLKDLGNLFS